MRVGYDVAGCVASSDWIGEGSMTRTDLNLRISMADSRWKYHP